MSIEWNAHRFSGGALALDVVNTVIYRTDPARRQDRFGQLEEINRFARAALTFRAQEVGSVRQFHAVQESERDDLIKQREIIDKHFRRGTASGSDRLSILGELLRVCGAAIGEGDETAFRTQVALSAVRLLERDFSERIRTCPNCDWLFLDRSKNGSRVWCDMAVCGNRHKARLNYRRRVAIKEASMS